MPTCSYPTRTGPCANTVTAAERCAAGHPARSHRAVATTSGDTAAVAGSNPLGGDRDIDVSPLLEHPALTEVIDRFNNADIELHVVGGPVRDLLDNGHPGNDLDLCTPADPATVKALLNDLGSIPDAGQEFGTVRLCRDGMPDVEITEWRNETYDEHSRKPTTVAATSLDDDLSRRDFTLNAIALDCRTGQLHDPHGGYNDLVAGRLRPPGDPDRIFSDDPLRTIRMVRFAATRGWTPDQPTIEAAQRQSPRLDVVARERQLTELNKMLRSPTPDALGRAIVYARAAGASDHLFGRLNVNQAATWKLSRLSPSARLPALAYATGEDAPAALRELKFPNDETNRAASTAHLAHQAEQVTSARDARKLVREATNEQVVHAREVSEVAGNPWPRHMDRAIAQTDVLRQPLPVNGHDAMQLGHQGPAIRDWLSRVEQTFLEQPSTFDRQQALQVE